MIESPILTASKHNSFATANSSWYLCNDAIRRVFDFPKKVKQIQFQAWPEPGRGRVKIKIKKLCGDLNYWDIEIDRGYQGVFHYTMLEIMKLTKKRQIWYIKLYYWI